MRFAFLLRNIFEREWKYFALVGRAQTKDTHTHTVLSTHCSRDSSFLSLLCRELHERTHAPKQARAQILWVIPHLETRGLAALWVKWSPLLITRARTDRLIFWGEKKWTFVPELFRLWDVDMQRYASAPRLCTYGVRGDVHSPETRPHGRSVLFLFCWWVWCYQEPSPNLCRYIQIKLKEKWW